MHPREERLAMNEVLFRKANDRIEDKAEEQAARNQTISFYCECSEIDCTNRITISGVEFENVRSRPTQFLVCPGHEQPDIETVVLETPAYRVVEKSGEAAEFVTEELDER
jgi:hypothetical protein